MAKSGSAGVLKRGPTALPKSRGSGFEEYFADPPMTAEEAYEEKNEIYHPSRSFVDRIEECIRRFRARRRMTSMLSFHLNNYLFLGGVDCSPRQFTGSNPADLRDLSPDERREATATDVVHQVGAVDVRHYNARNPSGWSVDFTAVAAGYLSENVLLLPDDLSAPAIGVVESFLRYVLQHDACPEYAADVKGALGLCARARDEFPAIHEVQCRLPGQFNSAATELFYGPDSLLTVPDLAAYPRPEGFDPKLFFEAAVMLAGEDEACRRLIEAEPGSVHVVGEDRRDLEVVEVVRPSDDVVRAFGGLRVKGRNGPGDFVPVGRAVLKPCVIVDGWCRPADPNEAGETLMFDDAILELLRPGLKLRIVICELSTGFRFAKHFRGVLPSFHTFLPQQLMKTFKKPAPDMRPPPSARKPVATDEDVGEEPE